MFPLPGAGLAPSLAAATAQTAPDANTAREVEKLRQTVEALSTSLQHYINHERGELTARIVALEGEVVALKKPTRPSSSNMIQGPPAAALADARHDHSSVSLSASDDESSQHVETDYDNLSQFLLDNEYPFNK